MRPSVIIGDSTTGEIGRCQGFHQIVGLVLQRQLPIFPASGDGYIDFVPRDVVAHAILALVREGVVDRDVWLTAGPQAPRLRDVLAVVVSTAARVFGRPMAMPRLIQGVDDARFLSSGPVSRRVAYRQLSLYAKYLSSVEALPTSFAELPYDPEATLAANVRHWCERAEAPGNLARSA